MFRKVKKKAGKPRKREIEEDNDDNNDQNDDDEATSLHAKIRETQKKQKILASLPLATGKGSTGRIAGNSNNATKTPEGLQQQQQSAATEELSVLASKHKSAMEEFIEQQIEASTPKAQTPKNDFAEDEANDDNNHKNSDTLAKDEEELYQQLSREAYTGSQLASKNAPKDDDKGAGGTMLAGSGIAEVILPADRRLASSTVKTTPAGVVQNKNIGGGSSSAVPANSTEAALPLTTPTPFGRSMMTMMQQQQSNRLPPQEQGGATPKGADALYVDTHAAAADDDVNTQALAANAPTPDSGRLGFEAIRGRWTAGSTTPTASTPQNNNADNKNVRHHKNRDDQVFSNFVKREFEGHRR